MEMKINKVKKIILLSGLLLIFVILIILCLKTYIGHFPFERYIPVNYLVDVTCIFIAIISIMYAHVQ
jgi:hypothetical protein